jgi:hypothetical protein
MPCSLQVLSRLDRKYQLYISGGSSLDWLSLVLHDQRYSCLNNRTQDPGDMEVPDSLDKMIEEYGEIS